MVGERGYAVKRIFCVMVSALLLVGVAASPVAAGRDNCVSFEGREYFDDVVDPGVVRVRDSSLAIRGASYSSTVTGHRYFEGASDIVFNLNLDLETLSGIGWGSNHVTSAHFEDSGFQGVYRVIMSDFDLDTGAGTYVGHSIGWGYGYFDGMTITSHGSHTIGDEYQTSTVTLCSG